MYMKKLYVLFAVLVVLVAGCQKQEQPVENEVVNEVVENEVVENETVENEVVENEVVENEVVNTAENTTETATNSGK